MEGEFKSFTYLKSTERWKRTNETRPNRGRGALLLLGGVQQSASDGAQQISVCRKCDDLEDPKSC